MTMLRHGLLGTILLALPPALSAQQGSYTFFGASCRSLVTSQRPVLVVEGIPRLGRAFTVGVDDGGRVRAGTFWDFLITGVSKTTWGPLVLPWTSPVLSGCPLMVSGESVLMLPAGSPLSFRFDVPNHPLMLGATFYQQWIIGWSPTNTVPSIFTTSNGGHAFVGA